MSSGDSFSNRGDALENQFFAEVDRRLLEEFRRKLDAESLAAALGLTSAPLCQELMQAGLTTQSAVAFRLVPMVLVAWADGRMEDSERQAVLDAAASQGIQPEDPAGKLLSAWLQKPPPASMLHTWVACARDFASHLSPENLEVLREGVIREMKDVAKASGGVLGWAAVSEGESHIMHEIKAALQSA